MSDVDRLHAAADICLTQSIGDPPPFDVALAALLRAVDHHYCDDDSCPLWGAALALADTILGAEECNTTRMHKNPADEYPREDGWGYG